MLPATYNFTVVRGTAGLGKGLIVRLKTQDGQVLNNMPYQDVRLSIYNDKKTQLLMRLAVSDGGLLETNPGESEVAWVPTTEQTRLIPISDKGRTAYYELEIWNGLDDESVYMLGNITGLGGVNDDQGAS